MPIYEYECLDCDKKFEILTTSGNDTKPVRCSHCKSEDVKKVISSGSFRLGAGQSLPSAPPTACGAKSGFS